MNAVELAFETYGDKTNRPLILLHGFFASSRNWRKIARHLAEFYRVYVVDLRNHGMSPHRPEMNYPCMVADLLYFMDEQGLQLASILGHSMGGKVAMWMSLNHPERVQKLIIADISPVGYQHNFDKTIQALKQLPLDEISNRKQADDFLALQIPEWDYRQFLLQNIYLEEGVYRWRVDLDIFQQAADGIIAFPNTESLPPYKDNSLFIMGEKSTYTDVPAITRCFPAAEIIVLKDTAHWLHVQSPAEFCACVIDFMNK